jgi:hypothetical protein
LHPASSVFFPTDIIKRDDLLTLMQNISLFLNYHNIKQWSSRIQVSTQFFLLFESGRTSINCQTDGLPQKVIYIRLEIWDIPQGLGAAVAKLTYRSTHPTAPCNFLVTSTKKAPISTIGAFFN